MKKFFAAAAIFLLAANTVSAEEYAFDTQGMHAAIQFRTKHLGFSWLHGRFNQFDGKFNYDADSPEDSSVEVVIQTNSVDSNHAERDKHLRGADFLQVEKFPESKFKSTSYEPQGDGKGLLKGVFTLNGVARPIEIDVEFVGAGEDPWGGVRMGFEGSTRFAASDFNINHPAVEEVEINISIEGVRRE